MHSAKLEIFVGLREGYEGKTHQMAEALELCQEYCNEVGLCVTVTPTTYVYKDGQEPGIVVGLIRYPRFPETDLWHHGRALGRILKSAFGQLRATIQDQETVEMLCDPDL